MSLTETRMPCIIAHKTVEKLCNTEKIISLFFNSLHVRRHRVLFVECSRPLMENTLNIVSDQNVINFSSESIPDTIVTSAWSPRTAPELMKVYQLAGTQRAALIEWATAKDKPSKLAINCFSRISFETELPVRQLLTDSLCLASNFLGPIGIIIQTLKFNRNISTKTTSNLLLFIK